jgi:small-conductance mechanosensitive channel
MKLDRFSRLLIAIGVLAVLLALKYFAMVGNPIYDTHTVRTLMVIAIILVILRIVKDIIIIWYRLDKSKGNFRVRDNLVVGISNLFSIFSVIAIALGLLTIFGLNIKEVFTTLSIVAAAIAIVTKDFISEMIIGIYSGFSNKIELEDYIKINDQKGKIIDIGLQRVTLLNDDDDIIYIPNMKFYTSEIINYTKRDVRRMSVDFNLDIKYLDDVDELEEKLINACEGMDSYLIADSFQLKIVNISKDVIDFKFQYTMLEVKRDVQRQMRKIIFRTIASTISNKNIHSNDPLSPF